MTQMLRITAKRDGYRRAGLKHDGTQDHDLAGLDEDQVEQLMADPELVCQLIEAGTPMTAGAAAQAVDEIVAETKAQAAKVVEAASTEASEIVANAKAEASKIVAAAKAEAEKIKAEAKKDAPEAEANGPKSAGGNAPAGGKGTAKGGAKR